MRLTFVFLLGALAGVFLALRFVDWLIDSL